MPALDAAAALGLTVVASAPLMQAKLTSGLPVRFATPSLDARQTPSARSRSCASMPGVTAALVGMKRVEHVDENLDGVRLRKS